MGKLVFWPYKMGSKSCKALSQELGAKRVYSNGRYRPRQDDVIINWGNGSVPSWWGYGFGDCLNMPGAVADASDKTTCLSLMHAGNVLIPDFAHNRHVAAGLFSGTRRVYCRTLTRASEGRGIVISNSVDELVPAPLYTAGIDGHRKEYRVHVFKGNVIDVVQKRKMSSEKLEEEGYTYDSVVRNHDRGWVFSRENIDTNEAAEALAVRSIEVLGLCFGAVDVIVRDNEPDQPYILEVNTAPGLEGTTLTKYAEAIGGLLG